MSYQSTISPPNDDVIKDIGRIKEVEGQKGRGRSKEKSDSSLSLKALTPTPLHRRDDDFDYLFFLKRFYEGVVLDTQSRC